MKKLLIGVLSSVGLLAFLYAGAILFVHYGTCTYLSEDETAELARDHIIKDMGFLVRHFNESAADVRAGKFVLFSIFDDRYHPYGVVYQTRGGQLVELEFTGMCGVRLSFPHRIVPRLDAIFVRDLRTGQPFIERSVVTGTSLVPGTEASHSGAILLPGGSVRP